MAEHIDKTIADLQGQLREAEETVKKIKLTINQLCELSGRSIMYTDAEETTTHQVQQHITPDMFYGQPLARAMRQILEMRKAAGIGPATPKEIYEALIDGGYAFETSNVQNRMTTVRISLRKSSNIFHRLPDGKRYGLLAWYPKAKNKKSNDNNGGDDDGDEIPDFFGNNRED